MTAPEVLDLPQIHQKPKFEVLQQALQDLKIRPSSWNSQESQTQAASGKVPVARYLMAIISSPLSWLSEEQQEIIWDEASKRIAERSGTTAMPAMTRSWPIPSPDGKTTISIKLHEPGLTEDNLGLKTWGSSYLLAKQLPCFTSHLTASTAAVKDLKVLELGAGTGLVGLAAAISWGCKVTLTDLPEIVSNLKYNVALNEDLFEDVFGRSERYPVVETLDWSNPPAVADVGGPFDVVLAADPIYDTQHAPLLASNVNRYLKDSIHSRVIIMHPLRDKFTRKLGQTLQQEFANHGLVLLEHGEEVGYDDWEKNDGERAEVTSWWGVWRRGIVEV